MPFLPRLVPGAVSALTPNLRSSVNCFPAIEQEYEAIEKSGVKHFHVKILRAAILKGGAEKAAAEKTVEKATPQSGCCTLS